MTDDLVVILTALDLEYAAVRARLTDLTPHRHDAGTRFEVGHLDGGSGRVALGLVGKGTHPAAVLAERAMAEFTPVAVLFAGVAGALSPYLPLGDVVIATHVYAYHGATSEGDGRRARPRVWETAHAAEQLAHHLDRVGTWRRHLPEGSAPEVHFGPIAAGEVVLDSVTSDEARWIREHYNDALAIEMEGAGVTQAGHLNQVPVVVVRGISDRADGTKERTDASNWQPRAAAHAAAFAVALAAALIDEAPAPAGQPTRSAPMNATNWNIATGNARVGIQAGHIYGDVHLGPDADPVPGGPSELATELATLRAELRTAHRAGLLDGPTRAAAEQELDTAGRALRNGTAGDRDTATLALKKVRGLVADVAGLATRVAKVIALARGTS